MSGLAGDLGAGMMALGMRKAPSKKPERVKLKVVTAPRVKLTSEPRSTPKWAYRYTEQLQVLADMMRREAAEYNDESIGSLAAILDAVFVLYSRTEGDQHLKSLELELSKRLKSAGVSLNMYRTMRLARGTKVGSVRAVWASSMRKAVEWALAREATPARVAGALWGAMTYDGPLSAMFQGRNNGHEQKIAAAIEAAPNVLKTLDPEVLVRDGLRAIGKPITGLTESQIRNLFSFENKQSKR